MGSYDKYIVEPFDWAERPLIHHNREVMDGIGPLMAFLNTDMIGEADLNIFIHHITDLPTQRRILDTAMDYCRSDRISSITAPDGDHPLDGYLKRWFDHDDKRVLGRRLSELFRRKADMALGAVAFASEFSRYLYDPSWFVSGVGACGLCSF